MASSLEKASSMHAGTLVLLLGALDIWLYQGKYRDDPSRSSQNDKALVRWAFQSLRRHVGFTWKLLYESGRSGLVPNLPQNGMSGLPLH